MRSDAARRNVFAITAASFMGYTGFTLVMPFLPLFIGELGVTDVGQIAMWTGLSLGVTPALTALLAPAWGRLGDRYGRKIMVERSLVSFVVLMAATAYVTRAWHVLALRAIQGLFAGYGSLSVAMAAEAAPRDRMPQAIGLVQTAQRIGPGVGPVIGGVLAGVVGLRHAFIATALFYALALVIVHTMCDDRATYAQSADAPEVGRVTFRSVLVFQNFILMMGVGSVLLGLGIGTAMTASYSAAGAVIPQGAHGAGFGVLTSASLAGMASSPFIAGFLGGMSLRVVFFVDLSMMAILALAVRQTMVDADVGPIS